LVAASSRSSYVCRRTGNKNSRSPRSVPFFTSYTISAKMVFSGSISGRTAWKSNPRGTIFALKTSGTAITGTCPRRFSSSAIAISGCMSPSVPIFDKTMRKRPSPRVHFPSSGSCGYLAGAPGLAFETWESTNLNPGPKTTQSAGCSILSSAAADERVGNHNPHTFEKLSTRLIHGSRPLPQFPLNLRSLCPVSGGFYHRLSLSSKGTPP